MVQKRNKERALFVHKEDLEGNSSFKVVQDKPESGGNRRLSQFAEQYVKLKVQTHPSSSDLNTAGTNRVSGVSINLPSV